MGRGMTRSKFVRPTRHVAKDLLQGYRLDVHQDIDVPLPALDPARGVRPRAFGRGHVSFEPEYVWRIVTDRTMGSIRIAPSGTVLLVIEGITRQDRRYGEPRAV